MTSHEPPSAFESLQKHHAQWMRKARLSHGNTIYTKWMIQKVELFCGGREQVIRFFPLDIQRAEIEYPGFRREGMTEVLVGLGGRFLLSKLKQDENVGLIVVGNPGEFESISEGLPEFRLVEYKTPPLAVPSPSPHRVVLDKMKRHLAASRESMGQYAMAL